MMTEPWPFLREKTAAAHRRLEALPRVARLFADDYRKAELAETLAVMLAVHRPLEQALAAGLDVNAFGYRLRWPLLVADLEALGWAGRIADVPFAPPDPVGAAAYLGVAYVIEGAMLGGQVIRQRLIGHFGPAIAGALGFYAPYGDDGGRQWRRFRQELDERLTTRAAVEECADAALFTFAHFAHALET